MFPELILREEQHRNYPLLALLGVCSVIAAYIVAGVIYPREADMLIVIFAAIPLVYPLTSFFFDDEADRAPHIPEIAGYFALFLGQAVAFLGLGYFKPDFFAAQALRAGISGSAISPNFFLFLLVNNIGVFAAITLVSFVTGSAGAFILSWNASVLGVFLANLLHKLPDGLSAAFLGTKGTAPPLAYVPHATFEMTGFILAGVSGSLMSAAVYREHFDWAHWKDFGKLFGIGALCIVIGALLESTGS
ncbi:MAG: stage II sporulation protein M [Candidatus Nanohalobium sp.]